MPWKKTALVIYLGRYLDEVKCIVVYLGKRIANNTRVQ